MRWDESDGVLHKKNASEMAKGYSYMKHVKLTGVLFSGEEGSFAKVKTGAVNKRYKVKEAINQDNAQGANQDAPVTERDLKARTKKWKNKNSKQKKGKRK